MYFSHFHVITKAFELFCGFYLFNAKCSYPSLGIKRATCSCFLIEEPLEAGVLAQVCCLFEVNIYKSVSRTHFICDCLDLLT